MADQIEGVTTPSPRVRDDPNRGLQNSQSHLNLQLSALDLSLSGPELLKKVKFLAEQEYKKLVYHDMPREIRNSIQKYARDTLIARGFFKESKEKTTTTTLNSPKESPSSVGSAKETDETTTHEGNSVMNLESQKDTMVANENRNLMTDFNENDVVSIPDSNQQAAVHQIITTKEALNTSTQNPLGNTPLAVSKDPSPEQVKQAEVHQVMMDLQISGKDKVASNPSTIGKAKQQVRFTEAEKGKQQLNMETAKTTKNPATATMETGTSLSSISFCLPFAKIPVISPWSSFGW